METTIVISLLVLIIIVGFLLFLRYKSSTEKEKRLLNSSIDDLDSLILVKNADIKKYQKIIADEQAFVNAFKELKVIMKNKDSEALAKFINKYE